MVKSPCILGRVSVCHGIACWLYLAGVPTPRNTPDITWILPWMAANGVRLSDIVCMATHMFIPRNSLEAKVCRPPERKQSLSIVWANTWIPTHERFWLLASSGICVSHVISGVPANIKNNDSIFTSAPSYAPSTILVHRIDRLLGSGAHCRSKLPEHSVIARKSIRYPFVPVQ